MLFAQFIVTPVAAFATSFSAGSVSLSPSASSTLLDRTLTTPNAQTFGEFGRSVAVSGNIVVVGAPFESSEGLFQAGHVYMFNVETGALIETLTSPIAQTSEWFGWSVAANGNFVIVGAPYAGHVYMFNVETGALIRTLTSPNDQFRGFGGSVAISGNIVAVGASFETVNERFYAGRVYTFDAETGKLVGTLTSPNPQFFGAFGVSVSVRGSILVVGAPGEAVSGQVGDGAGHVYTFNAETGGLISTLTSPNAQYVGHFGSSVSVRSNMVAVGAPDETVSGQPRAGHVYTFNAETGALIGTLTSPNAPSGGEFGGSIATSENMVIVGASSDGAIGQALTGAVYTFDAKTGELIGTLESPNPQSIGGFGFSVDAGGNVVVVGAVGETVDGQSFAGHAYTFD